MSRSQLNYEVCGVPRSGLMTRSMGGQGDGETGRLPSMPHNVGSGLAPQSKITKPSRLLWLTHEQLPHPEALICPADESKVRLVVTLLEDSYERRMGILQRLKAIANKLATIPPIERPSIPARMPNGLYQPISWRFALWLSHALGIPEDSRREELAVRLNHWLSEGEDCETISTHNEERNLRCSL